MTRKRTARPLARQRDHELAHRASRRLGPGRWQVTRRSLQQATPWQVARLKATWFGSHEVFDLCCGIGGDALALARRGPVVAVDSDPELAAMATANLESLPSSHHWQVRCADVTKIALPPGSSLHLDPDRRNANSDAERQTKTTKPEHYRPPWPEVCRMVGQARAAVVKIAPAAWARSMPTEGTQLPPYHRCWISLQGTVREQSIVLGEAMPPADVTPGSRSAVLLSADGSPRWYRPSKIADPGECSTAERPRSILVDPDAAIRAAGLTESFANEFGLSLLGTAAGFLTADSIRDDVAVLAQVGEVVWCGSCDDRKLRRELRSRNVYPQTIKVRGTDHDPNVLTQRYRKCGDQPVTLWIGRHGRRVVAAMTV